MHIHIYIYMHNIYCMRLPGSNEHPEALLQMVSACVTDASDYRKVTVGSFSLRLEKTVFMSGKWVLQCFA